LPVKKGKGNAVPGCPKPNPPSEEYENIGLPQLKTPKAFEFGGFPKGNFGGKKIRLKRPLPKGKNNWGKLEGKIGGLVR